MTIEILREMLAWALVINLGVLVIWLSSLLLAYDFVCRIHTKWFKISKEMFYSINYAGLIFFKIIILIFNIVPYFVLLIVA